MASATASFAATSPQQGLDFTGRTLRALITMTLSAGTYTTGGYTVPWQTITGLGTIPSEYAPQSVSGESVANPPSGIWWIYNPTTGKIQAFVGGAAGAASAEAANTVTVTDSVQIEAIFARQ